MDLQGIWSREHSHGSLRSSWDERVYGCGPACERALLFLALRRRLGQALPSFCHLEQPRPPRIVGRLLRNSQAFRRVFFIPVPIPRPPQRLPQTLSVTTTSWHFGSDLSKELRREAARFCSVMETAKTYRQYAEECRKLARSMPEHRAKLLAMAEVWLDLAKKADAKDGKKK